MGKFIIIEGPDFCGKSTQINLLDINGYFKDHDIFFTREPGSFLPESCDKCEEIKTKVEDVRRQKNESKYMRRQRE